MKEQPARRGVAGIGGMEGWRGEGGREGGREGGTEGWRKGEEGERGDRVLFVALCRANDTCNVHVHVMHMYTLCLYIV